MTKNNSDIFTKNLNELTTQFLNASESERPNIQSKIELIQSLMTGTNPKTTKDKKVKKSYDFSDVIGLGYGSKVNWLYRQYEGKNLKAEKTASGEFVGLVVFQLNGYTMLGIGFKVLETCLDMEADKIYGFKLESLRELKVLDR